MHRGIGFEPAQHRHPHAARRADAATDRCAADRRSSHSRPGPCGSRQARRRVPHRGPDRRSRRRVPLIGRASTVLPSKLNSRSGELEAILHVAIIEIGREGRRDCSCAQAPVEGQRVEALRDGGTEALRDIGLENIARQNIFNGARHRGFIGCAGEIRSPVLDDMTSPVPCGLRFSKSSRSIGRLLIRRRNDPGAFLQVIESAMPHHRRCSIMSGHSGAKFRDARMRLKAAAEIIGDIAGKAALERRQARQFGQRGLRLSSLSSTASGASSCTTPSRKVAAILDGQGRRRDCRRETNSAPAVPAAWCFQAASDSLLARKRWASCDGLPINDLADAWTLCRLNGRHASWRVPI